MTNLPTAHAALGASGAHRWMICAGSTPSTTSSEHAREGTAAHEVGSECLSRQINALEMLEAVGFVEAEGEEIEITEDRKSVV